MTQTYRLTNNGTGVTATPLLVALVAPTAPFLLGPTTCGPQLIAGGTCDVQVSFTPTAAGVFARTLQATATVGGTATLALRGSVGASAPVLRLVPRADASADFGTYVRGSPPATQIYALTNTGSAATAALSIRLSVATTGFVLVNAPGDCPAGAMLAVNQSCPITVRFSSATSPEASTRFSATLTATDAVVSASLPLSVTVVSN